MEQLNRRQILTYSLGASLLGATSSFAQPLGTSTNSIGSWQRMANMPFASQEIFPVAHRQFSSKPGSTKPVINTLLISAGGSSRNSDGSFNVSSDLVIYDPRTDAWRFGVPLPAPMHHASLISNSGYLYLIGGYISDDDSGWRMQERVFRLKDVDNGSWEEHPSLPIPQAEGTSVSLNGRLHVIGGKSPAGSINADRADHIDTDMHWAFIPGEDRWASMRAMPNARSGSASAIFRGALYVIGGRNRANGDTAGADVYDPVSNRWQSVAPLPSEMNGCSWLAAAEWNSRLYAFGGGWMNPSSHGVYSGVSEYDPQEDKWRQVAAMPRPRYKLGAVSLDDGIYVLGGASTIEGITSNALDRFAI